MAASVEQQAIIDHPLDRHGLVLAVAGSGKSFTIKERIAFMVEAKRIPASKIIAVMFNTGAATEFELGLNERLGKRNSPESATFHRLGTLTLRQLIKGNLAEDWEFEGNVHRALSFGTKVISEECYKRGFKFPRMVAEVFLGFVDRVKGDLKKPKDVWRDGDWDEKYRWFVDMYDVYERVRAARKIRFFSDLIYDPVVVMQNNPEAAKYVAGKYSHMFLDEYQDIGEAQQSLVRFVAGKTTIVMAVGDDDQTIYTWRGAKPSYILSDFERDFPGAIIYKLTRTRRYGATLSCAANYVITNNTVRADKLCVSHEETPDTKVNIGVDDSDGHNVLEIVEDCRSQGMALNDIAILVRTYSRSSNSQFALLQSGIAFRLEGGDNASVLDNYWVASLTGWMMLAAGKVAQHPYAGEPDVGSIIEVSKIINTPSIGLSRDGLNDLCKMILKKPHDMVAFAEFCRDKLSSRDGQLAEKILKRGKIWKKLRSLATASSSVNAYMLIDQLVIALSLEDGVKRTAKSPDDAADTWELISAFIKYVQSKGGMSLLDFLAHITNLKSFSDRAKSATDAIHITSIHRSKGLQWPCVIMVGLYQGGFPHKPRKALDPDKEWERIEDERRLFYVAMTRAMQLLWMLGPADLNLEQWHRAGKGGSPENLPYQADVASQFLYECNLKLSQTMPIILKRDLPTLKAGDPEVYNAYLSQLGIDRRAGKIDA